MLRIMYKSKIQKATITRTEINYAGSIGIDSALMKLADILPNEKVHVLSLDTGVRFETYAIAEKAGSGIICLYGPAAHMGKPKERVFIISYCLVEDARAAAFKPKVVYVDERNQIIKEVKKDV
ncbi:MAG: aspartate 1-decarboxylase [Candidatus Omnitrophota bacterium]